MTNTPSLTDLLHHYAAAVTPACGSCDADLDIIPDTGNTGVVHVNVKHDDWCPVLRRLEGRS